LEHVPFPELHALPRPAWLDEDAFSEIQCVVDIEILLLHLLKSGSSGGNICTQHLGLPIIGVATEADHNGDNGIWSGELGSGWEGGLRTIGMMRWPGRIRADWKSKEMFHVLDFFTTFAKITGAEIPTDRAIDGVDQTDFLLGNQENSNRDSRIVLYDGHERPVAIRYKQFKFHFIIYNKINPFQGGPEELGQIPFIYNLDTDPKEMFNLFGRSGGVAVFEPMMRDVMAPYMASISKFPNRDYSRMTRSE